MQGADDAWLIEDGYVTEASSATAHIVTHEGVLVTRELSHVLLPGITRAAILDLCEGEGLRIEERAFTRDEALRAREAFITSASNLVLPVTRLDGQLIGAGVPGPVTQKLRTLYIETRLANLL